MSQNAGSAAVSSSPLSTGVAATGASAPEQSGVPFAIVRKHNYRIEFGGHALEVDPTDGGRIIEFSLDGRSVVVPRSESAQAYGSSFWPSPQKDWDWPPPPELDALPWEVVLEGKALVLKSRQSARLELSATQRIVALPDLGAVSIEFRLTNHGARPRRVAGWQNTRVRPGGLTFFPSLNRAHAPSAFPLAPSGGVSWFAHDPKDKTRTGKVFADGEEGWLAHVDADLLFVKVFPPVSRERQAPGEAEVEIYVDPAGAFVEVEQQGPYDTLAPGESASWQVHWLLAKLDGEPPAASGDERLLSQARALVTRLR